MGKGGVPVKESAEERSRRKQGNRDKDSDSEYSYRSVYSAGGKGYRCLLLQKSSIACPKFSASES